MLTDMEDKLSNIRTTGIPQQKSQKVEQRCIYKEENFPEMGAGGAGEREFPD